MCNLPVLVKTNLKRTNLLLSRLRYYTELPYVHDMLVFLLIFAICDFYNFLLAFCKSIFYV